MARELVSKLQNLRKESGFEVTDRIEVTYQADEKICAMLETHREYIISEILALRFQPGSGETVLDVNGVEIKVDVKRA